MDKTSTFGARLVAALLSAALLSACGDAPINVAPTVDAADARDASMPVDLPPAADRGGPDLGVPDSSVPDAGAPDAGGPDLSVPDSAIADLLSDDEPFVRQRAACAFSAGALPSQTFGPSIANAAIPIDTFVILIKENRSFDHYFSLLPSRGQPDAEVAPAGASNPDSMGNPVARYHAPSLCTSPGVGDLAHSWTQMHNDWNNGAMDGFVRVNGVPEPMSYYDDTDLPFLYGLASTFAIADHYFAPVLGPTGPNRYFLYAGSSDGIIDTRTTLSASHANLFDMLSTAGVTWRVYAGSSVGSTFSFEAGSFPQQVTQHPDRFQPLGAFFSDAAVGQLPSVVFLRLNCSDEHPPDDVQIGQWNTQKVYQALASSPQWMRSALLVTSDEGGGFYDHVAPPTACAPDAVPPRLGSGDVPGDFKQLGFRVPLVVASAWARPHKVAHTTFDHTAILRLLELRFRLPALSARDANAASLLELFDFTAPSFAAPPSLPAAVIEQARKCNYPGDAICVSP